MKDNKQYNRNLNENYKPQWSKFVRLSFFRFILMSAFLLLLTNCSNEDDPPAVTVDRVLLVYMGGNNNLSDEVVEKLQAISKGYDGTPNHKILVYYKTDNKAPTSLVELRAKDNSPLNVSTYGDVNSADPEVFHRVILDALNRYPHASFNLLIFSHASGWLPDDSFSNPKTRSILVDGNKRMELSDFSAAIPDGMFQYIIFEMCYMAGIEVAYQLRDKTEYIIASSAEIVSPGFTPLYEKNVGDLLSDNPQTFVKKAFNMIDQKSGSYRSATFSVIQTDKLNALAGYVKAHCDFALETTINTNSVQHFDRGTGDLFYDFEDYYSRLMHTQAEKEQLSAMIENCVIWKAATPLFMEYDNGFLINKHSGFTSYITQSKYPNLNKKYTSLDWYKAIR